MGKVLVKIKINDKKIESIGLFNNNTLYFNDKNDKYRFNIDNLVLEKENEELKIKLDFKNKLLEYNLLEINNNFSKNFIVLALTKESKKYSISYQMDENIFNLEIVYEKYE